MMHPALTLLIGFSSEESDLPRDGEFPQTLRATAQHGTFRRARSSFVVSLIILATIMCSLAVNAEDWPQWRGANCGGVSSSTKKLPEKFSPTENVRWSAVVGDGISSPCVCAGRVYCTAMTTPDGVTLEKPEFKDLTQFVVMCFDQQSGKKLWQKSFSAGPEPLPPIHAVNSYASATPAADAERVYVYFTRIGLVALDATDGHQVWQYSVPEPFFIFDWGPGMSPVLCDNKLLFVQDDDLTPALYALNKVTGELLWMDDRSDMAVSYSHPIVSETASGGEIVVAGTGKLIGYEPETGRRKWTADVFCRNIKTTPASVNGTIYVSVEGYGMSYQWRATADSDGDGKITKAEILASRKDQQSKIPDAFWKKFERGDANGDGVLEGEEIDNAFLDPRNKAGLLDAETRARGGEEKDWKKWDAELIKEASIQAVRGGGEGDVSATHVLWKHKSKAPDHLISPLVAEGKMLLVKGNGILTSYETEKGTAVGKPRRLKGDPGSILASPVLGDGKIYIAAENGKIVVVRNDDSGEELAVNDMGEPCIGTPAIADGQIFLRTRTQLWCIETPETSPSSASATNP
jgi:outer membrane protein assembly factor BamB